MKGLRIVLSHQSHSFPIGRISYFMRKKKSVCFRLASDRKFLFESYSGVAGARESIVGIALLLFFKDST